MDPPKPYIRHSNSSFDRDLRLLLHSFIDALIQHNPTDIYGERLNEEMASECIQMKENSNKWTLKMRIIAQKNKKVRRIEQWTITINPTQTYVIMGKPLSFAIWQQVFKTSPIYRSQSTPRFLLPILYPLRLETLPVKKTSILLSQLRLRRMQIDIKVESWGMGSKGSHQKNLSLLKDAQYDQQLLQIISKMHSTLTKQ